MKTQITTIFFILLMGLQLSAQEVPELLDDAASKYKSGKLEDARFTLEQALNGINQAIGREMIALMPGKLGSMEKIEDQDNVTGLNTGLAGLFVGCNYKGDASDASIEIMSDSPLLAGINVMLSMPVFLATDPNQKRIKVDGQKALLTKSANGEKVSYEVQLVFGNTLFTFHTSGISSENEVLSMLDTIPVSDIIKVAN